MARLDVRVKTDLPARVVYPDKAGKHEEDVRLKELSLSGGVLVGFTAALQDPFLINLTLPLSGKLELCGESVKTDHGRVAARFYFRSKSSISALWEYMRERIIDGECCPYCGQNTGTYEGKCENCGCYLNFRDAAYLEKHLRNTFTERIQNKINRLDTEFIQKMINVIDCELMHMDDASNDDEFVGTSQNMLEVFSMIRKAAGTDMNILVLGESGTGKELTAKAIHERSERKDKPLVALNCAAIPEGLLEAELFGYEKGAFTGAYTSRKGKFEAADGGTIFLDEIGDLSPALQAKLLRFLEDRKIERIGGKSGKTVDVRIIAATNCDLDGMVEKGTFRTDLFYRLNSLKIKLPPLRDRGEDKVILAKYFFKKIGRTEGTSLKGFSENAVSAIKGYDWPGNVRELVNKVRRGLVMAAGEFIEPADMELADCHSTLASATHKDHSVAQRDMISDMVVKHNFVISHAARELRISRPTLYSLLKKYEIKIPPKD